MRLARLLLPAAIFVGLLIPAAGFGAAKTFVREYTYQASEADSKQSCRLLALEQVKRLLLEELGTYLVSATEVKDYQISKEEVTTLSGGVVATIIVKETWDGSRYWLQAKIEADPSDVARKIDALRSDREQAAELEALKKRVDDLLKENERLRAASALAKADKAPAMMEKSTGPVGKLSLEAAPGKDDARRRYADNIRALGQAESLQKAVALRDTGKLDEALALFDKAIADDPDNPRLYVARGMTYRRMNQSDLALADMNKAVALDPKQPAGYFYRGGQHLRAGAFREAIADYDRLITLNADAPGAYLNRGMAYARLKENGKAVEDFSAALRLDPGNPVALKNRGIAYLKLRQAQEAADDLAQAVKARPRDGEAHFALAAAYRQLGDAQRSGQHLRAAAKLGNKKAQQILGHRPKVR